LKLAQPAMNIFAANVSNIEQQAPLVQAQAMAGDKLS
jgi:hypothetical protein